MNTHRCEQCGTLLIETKDGYVTGCRHHTATATKEAQKKFFAKRFSLTEKQDDSAPRNV